ncbi:hypothetical protein BDF22DRAFT_740193 [Syncephalis plumigaleata]|nr:hypothetical protein BDF22DRAFT_740193 [Syncephalis plumigaleata]
MYVVISPPVIQLGLSLLAIVLFALLPVRAIAERATTTNILGRPATAERFQQSVAIPADQVRGVCSTAFVNKVTVDYVIDYFVGPSCVANTRRITWCNNGDSSDMAEEAAPTILSKSNRICIALSNANATSAVTVTLRAQLELVHSTNSTNDMAASQKNTASSSYGASSYRLLNVVPIFNLSLFTISLAMSF